MVFVLNFLGPEFWWGVFGGCLAEGLKWFNLRHTLHQGLPDWSKSIGYWVVTVFMILIGGGLVLIYVKSELMVSPILAVNIGASAPLIIGKLAELPSIEPGRIG